MERSRRQELGFLAVNAVVGDDHTRRLLLARGVAVIARRGLSRMWARLPDADAAGAKPATGTRRA